MVFAKIVIITDNALGVNIKTMYYKFIYFSSDHECIIIYILVATDITHQTDMELDSWN